MKTTKNNRPKEDNQKQPKNYQKLALTRGYTERDRIPVSVWIGQDFQNSNFVFKLLRLKLENKRVF